MKINVRQKMFLQDGCTAIAAFFLGLGTLQGFPTPYIVSMILLIIGSIVFVSSRFILKNRESESWDELTRLNEYKANSITLYIIVLLLCTGMLVVIFVPFFRPIFFRFTTTVFWFIFALIYMLKTILFILLDSGKI